MNTILNVLFSAVLFTSCAQEIKKITIYQESNNKKIKLNEIVVNTKSENAVYQIKYTHNEWQITDSIIYHYDADSICALSFVPEYDFETLTIKNYSQESSRCFKKNTLNDQYSMSQIYFSDIDLLFSLNAKVSTSISGNTKTLTFDQEIIPTLLLRYGIPFNEVLDSCSYSVNKKKHLINDCFYFKGYTVHRKYEYLDNLLSNVRITILNKEKGEENQFVETFEW